MGVLTKHMFEDPRAAVAARPAREHPARRRGGAAEGAGQGSRPALPDDEGDGARARGRARAATWRTAWGNEPSGVGGGLREPSQAFRTPGTTRARRRRHAAAGAVVAGAGRAEEAQRARRRRPGRAALAGGAAAVVLSQKKPVESAEAGGDGARRGAEADAWSRRPKPVEPAKPSRYTMSINTQPAGAEVFNGSERLGVTPCNVPLPASETPVDLMLKKKGFKEQTLKIVPDKDHDYRRRPHAARPSAHAPAAKTTKSTAPTPAATPPGQAGGAQARRQAARPQRPLRELTRYTPRDVWSCRRRRGRSLAVSSRGVRRRPAQRSVDQAGVARRRPRAPSRRAGAVQPAGVRHRRAQARGGRRRRARLPALRRHGPDGAAALLEAARGVRTAVRKAPAAGACALRGRPAPRQGRRQDRAVSRHRRRARRRG